MNNFRLKIAVRRNDLFLLIYVVGGTNPIYKEKIDNLQSLNFDDWDKDKECFYAPTQAAISDNQRIKAARAMYEGLIQTSQAKTPTELVNFIETAKRIETSKQLTLGQYIERFIKYKKSRTRDYGISGGYKVYLALLNKVVRAGMADISIADVDNKAYKRFCQYLKTHEPANSKNMASYLKTVLRYAHNEGHNDHSITYQYGKDAPKQGTKERKAFTKEQLRAFMNFNNEKLTKQVRRFNRLQTFKHICFFIYALRIRPNDVIKMKKANFKNIGGKFFYVYKPIKKLGWADKEDVYVRITPEAEAIIKAYWDSNNSPYLFPLICNTTDNTDVLHGIRNVEKNINAYIKQVCCELGINPDGLSLYSFRHTAITQAITDMHTTGETLMSIAKTAGTSVAMLEKYYYSTLAAITDTDYYTTNQGILFEGILSPFKEVSDKRHIKQPKSKNKWNTAKLLKPSI